MSLVADTVSRHVEVLYGPDGYYVVCRLCAAQIPVGEEAVIGEDADGAYVYAECMTHQSGEACF